MKYTGAWSRAELLYVFGFSAIIFLVALTFNDPTMPDWFNWINIISAVSGIICVILVAKGNILNYPIGFINVILYGYISYVYHWNGSMILNWFIFFPLNIIGWWAWNGKMDKTETVISKRLNNLQVYEVFVLCLLGIVIDMFFLRSLPDYVSFINAQNIPLLDSISTNLSILAMILMVYRYAEQWILWIFIDVVTIMMWLYSYFVDGAGAMPVLIMWVAFLINAVYGYLKWVGEFERYPDIITFLRGE